MNSQYEVFFCCQDQFKLIFTCQPLLICSESGARIANQLNGQTVLMTEAESSTIYNVQCRSVSNVQHAR